jgi:hypothetical protein
VTDPRLRLKRTRGALLRLAYRRSASFVIGLVLLAVAAVLVLIDRSWESWITDGLTLVCGATGLALIFMAFSGRRPDWIEGRDE